MHSGQLLLPGVRLLPALGVPALCAALLLAACTAATDGGEISREKAIEIARRHLEFEAQSTEAVRVTDEGRPVWQVTFRGEDIGPGRPIGEVLIVLVHRKTGEVVSIGMS